ncbi:hypothetical protein Pla22_30940 [Rubripirellula amarantea]|uniref:Uncharacterized protein n=1 Tax=Rubripirellula amarantea TaxID=2527999 RepID=A0A5C5WKF7_9BACT|nr:hypothetical protein Pla22_30940 [Rubripirellula amarantea]
MGQATKSQFRPHQSEAHFTRSTIYQTFSTRARDDSHLVIRRLITRRLITQPMEACHLTLSLHTSHVS